MSHTVCEHVLQPQNADEGEVGFRVGLVVEGVGVGGFPSHDGAQRQMSGNSDVTVEHARSSSYPAVS